MSRTIFENDMNLKKFYIDRKVSFGVIVSLIITVVTAVWAVADSRNQLNNMQKAIEDYEPIPGKVIRLEGKIDQVRADVMFIKDYLLTGR